MSCPTHHQKALALADQTVRARAKLITTDAIVLEIGNSLARLRVRESGTAILRSLRTDHRVRIEPVTRELIDAGFEMFEMRRDKQWSLMDCISFIVMRRHGLTEALTADDHFRQAGFKALMLE